MLQVNGVQNEQTMKQNLITRYLYIAIAALANNEREVR